MSPPPLAFLFGAILIFYVGKGLVGVELEKEARFELLLLNDRCGTVGCMYASGRNRMEHVTPWSFLFLTVLEICGFLFLRLGTF